MLQDQAWVCASDRYSVSDLRNLSTLRDVLCGRIRRSAARRSYKAFDRAGAKKVGSCSDGQGRPVAFLLLGETCLPSLFHHQIKGLLSCEEAAVSRIPTCVNNLVHFGPGGGRLP